VKIEARFLLYILVFLLFRDETEKSIVLTPVFRIRMDPKLFGFKDPDPKLLISDPDPAPDPDPPLFNNKL